MFIFSTDCFKNLVQPTRFHCFHEMPQIHQKPPTIVFDLNIMRVDRWRGAEWKENKGFYWAE